MLFPTLWGWVQLKLHVRPESWEVHLHYTSLGVRLLGKVVWSYVQGGGGFEKSETEKKEYSGGGIGWVIVQKFMIRRILSLRKLKNFLCSWFLLSDFIRKGYKDCERVYTVLPGAKDLTDVCQDWHRLMVGRDFSLQPKEVPPSLKEIIAEFSPHKGCTVSIQVVVPVTLKLTGMFDSCLFGTVSPSKWRETGVGDLSGSLCELIW